MRWTPCASTIPPPPHRRRALLEHFLVCSTDSPGGNGGPIRIESRWIAFDNDRERDDYMGWVKLREGNPENSLFVDLMLRKACQSMAILYTPEDRQAQRVARGPSRKIREVLAIERNELAADETALVFNEWARVWHESRVLCRNRRFSPWKSSPTGSSRITCATLSFGAA